MGPMAEHREEHSGQASKGIGGTDPREHNETSTGRGASGSARDESRRGVAHGSTSGGRSSNGSDREPRAGGDASQHRPSHPGQPNEMPLTMGSNGGGRDDDQPAGTMQGRQPRGTESHKREAEPERKHRKTS